MQKQNHGRHWTHRDDLALMWSWGNKRPHTIAKTLGRSVRACRARMLRLTGSASRTTGTWSQTDLAAETGYLKTDIARAVAALKLTGIRGKGRAPWRISEDQKQKILDWLRDESQRLTLTGMSCREAAEELGVSEVTVRDWVRRLQIDARKGHSRLYQLNGDDLALLRQHVDRQRAVGRGDIWSLRHSACVSCGTTERRHRGHGLCEDCYRGARK